MDFYNYIMQAIKETLDSWQDAAEKTSKPVDLVEGLDEPCYKEE